MHFNSEFFIRRAFYRRLAHLFATNLVRKMTEVKRTPPALCVRLETQCHADLKNVVTTNIENLWAPPRSAGPKTGHGSPRSEILATPLDIPMINDRGGPRILLRDQHSEGSR